MQDNQEKCKELAIRIYNLDEEVYKCVGSSLGRTFTGQKETTLRHLAALMYTKPDGHLLRSELALISNMARTIRDKSERRRLMIEYDSILKEIALGKTTKEIAAERNLSFHTVNSHRKNIFRKLNVNNAHEATKYAMKAGIVDLVEYYI
jgi:DNA-binding CsgD family transcriptional regulator